MHKGLVVGGADNFNQKYWLTHVDVTKVPLVLANRAVGGLSILPRNLDFKAGGAILESLPRPSKLVHLLVGFLLLSSLIFFKSRKDLRESPMLQCALATKPRFDKPK